MYTQHHQFPFSKHFHWYLTNTQILLSNCHSIVPSSLKYCKMKYVMVSTYQNDIDQAHLIAVLRQCNRIKRNYSLYMDKLLHWRR